MLFRSVVAEGPTAARAGPGAGCLSDASGRAGPTSATGDKVTAAQATRPWHGRVVDPGRGDEAVADLGGSQVPDGYGCLVWSSTRSTAPAPRRPGTTGQDPGGEGGVDAGLRVGGSRSLPGWRHAIGPRFVSFLANREPAKQPNQQGRGREVDVMSRQRRKQRRNAARRPWWRPLVGLGLLAGWLAVSKRGRQAVKAGKEQTAKASRKLAAPARVGPPQSRRPSALLQVR